MERGTWKDKPNSFENIAKRETIFWELSLDLNGLRIQMLGFFTIILPYHINWIFV